MITTFPIKRDLKLMPAPGPTEEDMRVLLVENPGQPPSLLHRAAQMPGITVDTAHDAFAARILAFGDLYDVVVVELSAGGVHGIQLCQEMREDGITTPILLLSCDGTIDDVVRALNAGADDYLVKPIRFDLLVARLVALHRAAQRHMTA